MSAPRKETDEVEQNDLDNDSGESSGDERSGTDESEIEGEQTSGLEKGTADQNGGTNVLRDTPIKEFSCDICLQPFPSSSGMKNHIHQKHPEEAQIRVKQSEHYPCPVGWCKKSYVNWHSLQYHMGSKHTKFTKNELRRSGGEGIVQRDVDNTSSEPRKSSHNETADNTQDFLRDHRAEAHYRKPYCYVCGEKFDTVKLLINHKRLSTCGDGVSRRSRQEAPETKKRCWAANEDSDSENDDEAGPSTSKKIRTITEKVHAALHTKTSKNASSAVHNLSVKKECPELRTPLSKDQKNQQEARKRAKKLRKEDYFWKILAEEQEKEDEISAWQVHADFNDHVVVEVTTASNGESSLKTLSVKSEPPENHQNNRRASIAPTLGSPVAQRLESLQNEVPTGCSNVEYSSLPLLAVMGARAEHAKELLVVWNPTINEDLLLMASNKASNIILCVHSTEVMNMSPQARELWKHTHQTQFFITTSNGKGTSWTAMAFSAQLLPETLRNSFYDQIQKVEAEFRQMADSLQMEMINFVIFGTEGLFPLLSTSFVNKMIATNCRQ